MFGAGVRGFDWNLVGDCCVEKGWGIFLVFFFGNGGREGVGNVMERGGD